MFFEILKFIHLRVNYCIIKMEFVLSERGKSNLILNSYKYYSSDKTAIGRKWRCINRTCTGKVVLDEFGTTILTQPSAHNHSPVKNLERKIVSAAVKRKAVDDITVRPSKIINSVLRSSPMVMKMTTNDIYNIRKCAYAARRSIMPPLPGNMSDVHECLNSVAVRTVSGEDFLLENDCTNNIIIFSCKTNLMFLCTCDRIYVDGTFKCCTQYFYQFFTIHAIKNGHYVPLVFCLLPNKEKASYKAIFDIISRKCLSLGYTFYPVEVVADFEKAIHSAVTEMWPNSSLKGCRFHLAQSWWRKIQNVGLTAVYKDKESDIGKWLRLMFGLAFVPSEEVIDAFFLDICNLQPQDERVQLFSDYILNNYIFDASPFPPKIWASCAATSELTTNACESFHSKFNEQFYSPHPNIFNFLEVLKDFQANTYVKINSTHLPVKINNRKYKLKLSYLDSVVNNFKSGIISRFDLIQRTSHHYHHV